VIDLRGTCGRHRGALLDFVDRGEIEPGTAQALAHLERCGRCSDELESAVLTITALRRYGDDLGRFEPAPDAWPRLRARLDGLKPARWAIMSPSAGMVVSVALVAVLVAPLRIGTTAAGPNPTIERDQLAISLEDRRVEAAYLSTVRRLGTFPKDEPVDRRAVTYPRNYPDNVRPDRKEVTPAEPSGRPPEAI